MNDETGRRTIYCLSHYDLVKRRRTTNRLSDVRLCQGLARNGADVHLIVPYTYRRDNVSSRSLRDHYGLTEPMSITTLPTPLWDGAPRWIRVPIWSAAVLARYAAARARARGGRAVWISRDHNAIRSVLLARRILRDHGSTVVFWAHDFRPKDRRSVWVYRHADGVLATNSAIRDDLEAVLGVPKSRTAVTLNPVPAELFEDLPTRAEARRRLGLEENRPLVVYTGKLGPAFKEVEYLLQAAIGLPEARFVVTGGAADAVSYWERRRREARVENIAFTGWLDDWQDVRRYQIAGDALVSYYTSEMKLFDYNYPQKITEYMASLTPLITLDARATQDVLNERNAIFVEPHSTPSLIAGIRRALEDPKGARVLAERAFEDARAITLERRGAEVLAFLERIAVA